PLQVVPQKLVAGGTAVHEGVGDEGGRVAHGDADGLLGLLENEHVGVVAANQELEVLLDGDLSAEDAAELLDALLMDFLFGALRRGEGKKSVKLVLRSG